jgi:hypothetical protein
MDNLLKLNIKSSCVKKKILEKIKRRFIIKIIRLLIRLRIRIRLIIKLRIRIRLIIKLRIRIRLIIRWQRFIINQ